MVTVRPARKLAFHVSDYGPHNWYPPDYMYLWTWLQQLNQIAVKYYEHKSVIMNFTSQETNQVHHILKCAQQKLHKHYYNLSDILAKWVGMLFCDFSSCHMHFVIMTTTVDSTGEEEEEGKKEGREKIEGGGKWEEEGRKGRGREMGRREERKGRRRSREEE